MGFFSKFEGKMEDTFEGAAGKMQKSPISPVQIMKKAEKQMRREKVVSAGKQYAPTLYTVLVNPDDDQRLFGFYPTLAGETETRLAATAGAEGLAMDGQPLVRFIVDEALRHGKFDIIAEVVSAPIVEQLRAEEMQRYGMAGAGPSQSQAAAAYSNASYSQGQRAPQPAQPAAAPADYGQQIFADEGVVNQPPAAQQQPQQKPPLPYVPEEEIDYSIDYGEYTFDSQNFEDYRNNPSDQAQAEEPAAQHAPRHAAVAPAPQQAAAPDPYANPYAQQGAGAYPLPNPAYPPMGQYGQQAYGGYAPGQGAYPSMGAVPSAAPTPAPAAAAAPAPTPNPTPAAYGAAPHTVAFAAGAAQVNAVPNQAAVRARLIDVASNRAYDLATARVLVGRETSNDIVLNDLNVSRQHAQIAYEPQGVWVVTDLGSTNGTLVNGMPISRRGLADGDRITLGMTELVFSMR